MYDGMLECKLFIPMQYAGGNYIFLYNTLVEIIYSYAIHWWKLYIPIQYIHWWKLYIPIQFTGGNYIFLCNTLVEIIYCIPIQYTGRNYIFRSEYLAQVILFLSATRSDSN